MKANHTRGAPKRHKFTFEEDLLLRKLVLAAGDNVNWEKITQKMGNKLSTRQCRERYRNYLSPKLNHGPWTPQEESILLAKYKEIGPHWSKMMQFFVGRSEANIKNHYAKLQYRSRKNSEKPKKKKDLVLPPGVFDKLIESFCDSEMDPFDVIFNENQFILEF